MPYAVLSAQMSDGKVNALSVTNGGYGYTEPPQIIINAPQTGTQAKATAYVVAGVVINAVVTDQGSGYTTTPDIFVVDEVGTTINLDNITQNITSLSSNIQNITSSVENINSSIDGLTTNFTTLSSSVNNIIGGGGSQGSILIQGAVGDIIPTSQMNYNIASGVLTVNNPIQYSGAVTQSSQLTNKSYVDNQLANLVAGAPAQLDTLQELANALGGDANFSATVTNLIGTKASKTELSDAISNTTVLLNNNISSNVSTLNNIISANVALLNNNITANVATLNNVIVANVKMLNNNIVANIGFLQNTLNYAINANVSSIYSALASNVATLSNSIAQKADTTALNDGLSGLATVFGEELSTKQEAITASSDLTVNSITANYGMFPNLIAPIVSAGVIQLGEGAYQFYALDNTPTQYSTNPIYSGGVYDALSTKVSYDEYNTKVASIDGSIALKDSITSVDSKISANITAVNTALNLKEDISNVNAKISANVATVTTLLNNDIASNVATLNSSIALKDDISSVNTKISANVASVTTLLNNNIASNVATLNSSIALKANVANPTFTGNINIPNLNLTSLANTSTSSVLYYDSTSKIVTYGNAPRGNTSISGLTSDTTANTLTIASNYTLNFGTSTSGSNVSYTSSGVTFNTSFFKFGTASASFGASGNPYLKVSNIVTTGFNNNLFCLECWFYPTTSSADQTLFSLTDSSNNEYIWVRMNTSRYVVADFGNNGAFNGGTGAQSTNQATLNTWNHIVFQYDGTGYQTYINGSRGLNYSQTGLNLPQSAFGQLYIGSYGLNNTPQNSVVSGYIDEIRFSTINRYSGASLTLPTSAFTTDSNTVFLHHFNGVNGTSDFTTGGQDAPALTTTALGSLSGSTGALTAGNVNVNNNLILNNTNSYILAGSANSSIGFGYPFTPGLSFSAGTLGGPFMKTSNGWLGAGSITIARTDYAPANSDNCPISLKLFFTTKYTASGTGKMGFMEIIIWKLYGNTLGYNTVVALQKPSFGTTSWSVAITTSGDNLVLTFTSGADIYTAWVATGAI